MNKKATKGEYLEILLRSPKTVFSNKEIALLWGEEGTNAVRVRLNSYAKAGKLLRLRRGLYAKDNDYNKNELATKIFIPSYISFETVLGSAGVTFQYYSQIFLASYQSKELTLGSQKYSFRRVKENILTSNLGMANEAGYSIASTERAFLDVLYLNKRYHFDNLRPINWEKVYALLPIYDGNKRMEETVNKLAKSVK